MKNNLDYTRFGTHDFIKFHVLKKYNLTKGAQMSYDYRKGKKKKNGSMISSRILILLLFSNLYCDISKEQYKENERSINLAKRLSFHYDGMIRMGTRKEDGTIYDDLLYSLTKRDFEENIEI